MDSEWCLGTRKRGCKITSEKGDRWPAEKKAGKHQEWTCFEKRIEDNNLPSEEEAKVDSGVVQGDCWAFKGLQKSGKGI